MLLCFPLFHVIHSGIRFTSPNDLPFLPLKNSGHAYERWNKEISKDVDAIIYKRKGLKLKVIQVGGKPLLSEPDRTVGPEKTGPAYFSGSICLKDRI
jgi:hypothetical protein